MDRPDDISVPPETAWLSDPGAQNVCGAVSAGGARIFIVGGCVRDALLGLGGADVDLATDAEPDTVIALAEAAGLRAVPTGIEHGTVTVVAAGNGYEVTTFRQDVETHGRRATVSFSKDMRDDALRRDFTLNALYATADGLVIDPLGGGIEDCLSRRIRFIEDATTRIREDYLRILRYFRFHAWYAAPDAGFDAEALDAIASNSDGLETLSAERIGSEMLRLFSAPDPAPAVATMRQTGVLQILLPGADDRYLAPVVHLEATAGTDPDAVLRLAALGGQDVADRLRLSRVRRKYLSVLNELTGADQGLAEISYRHDAGVARAVAILRAAIAGQPVSETARSQIALGSSAVFPICAADLMPAFAGKALGDRLAVMESRWIASGFSLTREELMSGL